MDTTSIPGLSTSGTSVISSQGGTFGDNPFLSLLVTEMRTQTPLDPVDNASFMQQMASFSSMEEQKQLNDNLLQLLDFQGVLARLQGLSEGSGLLGKEVTFEAMGNAETGVVDSVFVDQEGVVKLRVGDHEIGLREVVEVRNAPSQS